MLTQLFSHHNGMLFPFALAFVIVDVIYAFRLIQSIRHKGRRHYTYHALWIHPYLLLLLCALYPHGYFSGKCLAIIFLLWLFSAICAILQVKISSNKMWGQILEEIMDRVVRFVDRLARCAAKCSKYEGPFYVGWVIVAFLILTFAQQLATLFVIGSCAFYLLATADQCKHSCKLLVLFWLKPCIVIAILMHCMSFGILPRNITNGPLAYGIGCIALAFFWGLSAAFAEYDVAKMAGEIINTITTILLVVANALVGWLSQTIKTPPPNIDWNNLVYEINSLLLPIVAAGFLSMLFIDGLAYYKKKHPAKESMPDQPNPQDEPVHEGTAECAKQKTQDVSEVHDNKTTTSQSR